MSEKLTAFKAALAVFFGAVGDFLGWKGSMLLALAVFMAVDYISGTLAAKKCGEWSSTKAREGLFHKGGIILVVTCALIADLILMFVIPEIPFFGGAFPNPGIFLPLVLAWYIVTEFGSILENAMKMGAPVPEWFRKAVENTGKVIDKAGEKAEPESEKNTPGGPYFSEGDENDAD